MARLLLLALLAGWLMASPGRTPAPRRQTSEQASRMLMETSLFAEGRGMHFRAPGVVPLYRLFERLPLDVNGLVGRYLGANMQGPRAIGMFEAHDKGRPVVAFGCVLCHSGRAAGRLIVGLGNKRIDVGSMGALGRAIGGNPTLTAAMSNPRWTNRTRGLVPDALIQRWFYANAGLPVPADLPAAVVKVPHLWGYGEKRRVGLFADGLGDGAEPGWAAMVELATGQTPETVRGYRHKLDEVEQAIGELLPPAYPFLVETDLAERGRRVFEQECAACHGEYRRDADGLPRYEAPRHIAWETVQTDRLRLLCVTPEFRRLIETSPLKDLIRTTGLPPGYFAPRLEGVWSRFPYLHNASVPTIQDLLTEPARRPTVWSLKDAGEESRFDQVSLGLKVGREKPAPGNRDVYSTDREGQSNQGHPFGSTLPESSKRALIEYLKTL